MKEQENPYLNARKKHNEYEGGLIASRHMWQIFGVLGLITGLGGIGGVIHIGSQSKYIPYVVEVDKLGQTHAVSIADRAAPADPRIISSLIARTITLARMVTPDVLVQRNAIFELYASLNSSDPAALKMTSILARIRKPHRSKERQKKPWMCRSHPSSLSPMKHGRWTGWRQYGHAATAPSFLASGCGLWSASMWLLPQARLQKNRYGKIRSAFSYVISTGPSNFKGD